MMLWGRYGDHWAGGYIDERIQTNIGALLDLTDKLYHAGYKLVSYNTEGILYNVTSELRAISPSIASIPKEESDELRDDMINLNHFVTTNRIDISELRKLLLELKAKTDNVSSDLENNKGTEGTEVTNEFFILFDFLPEHIKKELKIYIKK